MKKSTQAEAGDWSYAEILTLVGPFPPYYTAQYFKCVQLLKNQGYGC